MMRRRAVHLGVGAIAYLLPVLGWGTTFALTCAAVVANTYLLPHLPGVKIVRDVALSLAGLLSPKLGGPSIFPPVPENVLAYNYSKVTYWDVPTGPDRYRRSLYVFRKRSMPDPMLSAFDAPNGDYRIGATSRSRSVVRAPARR